MNVLHLEDSDNDAEMISEALRHHGIPCRVTRVETRKAFLEAMDHGDWDMILADYALPSFDGISALKLAVGKRPGVPFIFVTGSLGEERAVAALKNGATDYIPKHRLDRLPLAVIRAMRESKSAEAQKEADRKLKASLREKELLLQEVHHRVKNNLQIISSLLNMQSNAVDDPLLVSALQESQKRIQAMSMIHEMLYACNSLNDIDFAEYTRLLAVEVSSSQGVDPARIRLAFELEPIHLELDRAIPCGLILNELLSNALKHAFPKGRSGEIRVSLQQQGLSIRLAIEDTGVGLPEGRSPGETKSFGLRIVHILTEQLGGTLDITSNQGSHFVLKFDQITGNPPGISKGCALEMHEQVQRNGFRHLDVPVFVEKAAEGQGKVQEG
jgi:two-component sensor histidine kinase